MENSRLITTDGPIASFLTQKDPVLGRVIHMVGDLKYSIHNNPYEFLIHEIIEQMLSTKSAATIFSRFNNLCNGCITPLMVRSLSFNQVRSCGMSSAKVEYIFALTAAVLENKIDFSTAEGKTDNEIIKELTSIRGIGSWTAKMYLIFVLDRPDILPYEDGAFRQAFIALYGGKESYRNSYSGICNKWKPYSSIAVRYLYRFLDAGFSRSKDA